MANDVAWEQLTVELELLEIVGDGVNDGDRSAGVANGLAKEVDRLRIVRRRVRGFFELFQAMLFMLKGGMVSEARTGPVHTYGFGDGKDEENGGDGLRNESEKLLVKADDLHEFVVVVFNAQVFQVFVQDLKGNDVEDLSKCIEKDRLPPDCLLTASSGAWACSVRQRWQRQH